MQSYLIFSYVLNNLIYDVSVDLKFHNFQSLYFHYIILAVVISEYPVSLINHVHSTPICIICLLILPNIDSLHGIPFTLFQKKPENK